MPPSIIRHPGVNLIKLFSSLTLWENTPESLFNLVQYLCVKPETPGADVIKLFCP